MVLSLNDIYNNYSVRKFARKIEIKRQNTNGTYESTWKDIELLSGLKLLDDSVGSINYALSDSTYNFGIVTIGNVSIKLNSKNGQFDDEGNPNSIFSGFVRHKSLIKISDGYVDYYSDPNNPLNVLFPVFQGFIDETSSGTKVDDENLLQTFQCVDVLSFLLKNYTLSDVSPLTSTNLKDLIFEILNRSIFTDFFTVDITKIIPGYNILNIDISQYEGQTQLYTILENLSIGHSFFYIRDDSFFYKRIDTGISSSGSYEDFLFQNGQNYKFQNQQNFQFNKKNASLVIDSKKLIKFSSYNAGIENVIEKLFWDGDPSISFTSPTNKYNKTKTIKMDGVTNNIEKQNVLNTIGNITKLEKKQFTIEVPYIMFINVLDLIIVKSPQIIPSDAFIWGISKWGQAKWRKSLQADSIANNQSWLVTKINHNKLVTKITLKEI